MRLSDGDAATVRFIVFDAETARWDEGKGDWAALDLFFIAAAEFELDLTTYHETPVRKAICRSADEFIDFLFAGAIPVTAFCHNADFDFNFIIQRLLARRFTVEVARSGSRIIRVVLGKRRSSNRTILGEIRNTLCLYPSSLKRMGDDVSLAKLEMPVDDGTAMEAYSMRDCEIPARFLAIWAKAVGATTKTEFLNKTLTAAGAALRLFRERYARSAESFDDEEFSDGFRRYYSGGRTEVLRGGILHDVTSFDVNSEYPYILIASEFPLPPYTFMPARSASSDAAGYIAEIDESAEAIPLIPQRDPDRLRFRAGRKTAFIWREEYEYLRGRGVPVSVESALLVQRWDSPFRYLQEIYEQRLRYHKLGQAGMAAAFKIVLNSTYGRFGLNLDREAEVAVNPDEISIDEIGSFIVGDGFAVSRKKERISAKINVVWAARTTALARLYLTRHMHMLRNPIYCDTDSVFAGGEDAEVLATLCGDRLGQFKKEKVMRRFVALGPKDYLADAKPAVKGVRVDDALGFLRYHEEGVTVVRPARFRESVVAGVRDGEPLMGRQRVLQKRAATAYSGRWVFEGGSRPLLADDSPAAVETANAAFLDDVRRQLAEEVKE